MTDTPSTLPHDADGYAIRVHGRLDARWSTYLDGAHLTPDGDGTTVVTTHVVDQAGLHGVLARLRDLGLPLISVTRIDPEPTHPHTTGEPT